MSDLKRHVTGQCQFVQYRAGNLLYRTESGLEFPVPISDTGEATFPAQEKAIFFMRWIRQHLATISNTNTN